VIRRGLLNIIGADGVKVVVTLKAGVVFGELSLLNVPGSVNGNRRTVTVRSVGYAELFSLSKEDFWTSLEEYPEVKDQLMEKAKKTLQKDNLVDENIAREQGRRGRNFQAVADKLEESLETVTVRMDRFWQEQIDVNQKLLKKLNLMEDREKALAKPAADSQA
jgi:CRP-like cAMP-binding protein